MRYSSHACVLVLLSAMGCSDDAADNGGANGYPVDNKSNFPDHEYSIMRKEDSEPVCIPGKMRDSLTGILRFKGETAKRWTTCTDKYGRPINKIASPEMSYGDLQELLDFKGCDVTFHPNADAGKPHATIETAWLGLDVIFNVGPQRDGSNQAAMCRAVITEHRFQEIVDQRRERTYRYPSIMEKEDAPGGGRDILMSQLTSELCIKQKWELIRSARDRLWKYASPVLTYSQLQQQINFNDTDVTPNLGGKEDGPDAWIRTPWYTCEIEYLAETYAEKDKSVKLRAVIIDNEVNEKVQLDEKAGVSDVLKRILRGHP